jgi:hypothetical protein
MAQASDVLEALRQSLPEIAERADKYAGYFQVEYGSISIVARQAGIDEPDWATGKGRREWERFSGQVGRAMSKLADEGTIIKVGRGERTPGGYMAKSVRYYMPDRYEALRAEHMQQQKQHAETRSRWAEVTEKVERIVGPVQRDHLQRPMPSLEQWNEILESLVTD